MSARSAAELLVAERYRRIAVADRPEAWITLRPEDEVTAEVAAALAAAQDGADLPLAGRLLAVKNNIDVAGIPTTAACPAFAYDPEADATVVRLLIDAGAVVLGTTNLDQFATGLVGSRSPYGAVRHPTDPARISGGSSSGSAVAVAIGAADIALGTDTAGSGRVPAALCGLVGVKPTKGTVSAVGVVPACRSNETVSVMAADLALARLAAEIITVVDEADPLSREMPDPDRADPARWVIGVPDPLDLGDLAPGWAEAFADAVRSLTDAGATVRLVDIQPLLDAAALLYSGAYVAERYAAVGAFVSAHPDEVDPTVRRIILGAADLRAADLFADMERIDRYKVVARRLFGDIDALLLPTTVRHPTLAEIEADPLGVNGSMGRFTNFANLLDLAALAVPAGTVDGLPFGVQLIGPAFSDRRLATIAGELLE
ncbi:allophanate hydrolase [Amnibacterium flavum]|uniref:allophanate hydrolase n=1 Tax=Amnibacterium flavum TaxID=2173173 RepID=UPI001F0BED59|nr:allophanate hydrolase [Amnibacterium flavum]